MRYVSNIGTYWWNAFAGTNTNQYISTNTQYCSHGSVVLTLIRVTCQANVPACVTNTWTSFSNSPTHHKEDTWLETDILYNVVWILYTQQTHCIGFQMCLQLCVSIGLPETGWLPEISLRRWWGLGCWLIWSSGMKWNYEFDDDRAKHGQVCFSGANTERVCRDVP